MQKTLIYILASCFIAGACNSSQKATSKKENGMEKESLLKITNNLEQLAKLMCGTFENKEQHLQDPENYHHIVMKICPIWSDRSDGRWFYIEQGLATMPDRPYRQRVYRLHRGERDTLISEVYTIPDAKNYIGGCEKEKPLGELRPNNLELREGCSVFMTKKESLRYEGGTQVNSCASTLNGAAFVDSHINISFEEFKTWDRGFDSLGNHIWGAEKGAYLFKRTK